MALMFGNLAPALTSNAMGAQSKSNSNSNGGKKRRRRRGGRRRSRT